ncbi:cell wall hydrolase [Heyndrickxia sporothermodurans]|uniref:cell wall hydrolase n=1 Tax=Heyndrickxia sporothermodurans TaxID=46224 RepID=UPI002DB8EC8A|nr:cell wall hydrolase [Heyndrickxia sporothermodurans]MEB6548654.1 cell wall hydrolase [Heyndrickxia sporothermodurans]
MKNILLKSIVVACVATTAFIGIQNRTAEAFTGQRVVKSENVWDTEQQQNKGNFSNINKEQKNDQSDVQIKKMAQIPDKTKVLAKKSVKQFMKNREKHKSVSISANEKDLLARLVEAEAKGESYEGKVAVATVVLNRVDSPNFPDTVTSVIKQVVGHAYAFSPVQNGAINKPASSEAKQAVKQALTRKNRLHGSVYFYNPKIATDKWIQSRKVVTTIGNHVFLK